MPDVYLEVDARVGELGGEDGWSWSSPDSIGLRGSAEQCGPDAVQVRSVGDAEGEGRSSTSVANVVES